MPWKAGSKMEFGSALWKSSAKNPRIAAMFSSTSVERALSGRVRSSRQRSPSSVPLSWERVISWSRRLRAD